LLATFVHTLSFYDSISHDWQHPRLTRGNIFKKVSCTCHFSPWSYVTIWHLFEISTRHYSFLYNIFFFSRIELISPYRTSNMSMTLLMSWCIIPEWQKGW